MRSCLNMLLFLSTMFCLGIVPVQGNDDVNAQPSPDAQQVFLELMEKHPELARKLANHASTPPITGDGTLTPPEEFERCIRNNSDWSACYNTPDGTRVGKGYSGFYSSVYDNKDFDMDSVWLKSPAGLATAGPSAK